MRSTSAYHHENVDRDGVLLLRKRPELRPETWLKAELVCEIRNVNEILIGVRVNEIHQLLCMVATH